MDGLRDAFEALRAAAEAAAAQSATVVRFAIGGHNGRTVLAGPAMAASACPPFSGLEAPTAPVSLDLIAFDSEGTEVRLPPALGPLERFHALAMPGTEAQDGIHVSFQRLDSGLMMFDVESGRAAYWTPSARRAPIDLRASPFRTALSWWLGARGIQLVHAAAVGDETGALLLAGAGGSGKSTTALTALAAGMSYLGDDYCAVASAPAPVVHRLYATAKVHAANLPRLPEFAAAAAQGPLEGEKLVVTLDGRWRARLATSLPILALVAPVVSGAERSSWAPIGGAHGLRALAPSTVLQLAGGGTSAMRAMAALARAVPAYSLSLGEDRDGVVGALREILAHARGRQP